MADEVTKLVLDAQVEAAVKTFQDAIEKTNQLLTEHLALARQLKGIKVGSTEYAKATEQGKKYALTLSQVEERLKLLGVTSKTTADQIKDKIRVLEQSKGAVKGYSLEYENLQKNLTALRSALKGTVTKDVDRSLKNSTKELINVGRESKKAGDTLGRLRNALKGVSTEADVFAKAGNAVLLSWRSVARVVAGTVISRFTTDLIRGLQRSVVEAQDLSIAVGEIQTVSLHASLSTERWTEELLKLSDAFGVPVLETTEAAYQALSDQVGEGAEIMGFMTDALRLARLTMAEASTAAAALASVLNAYNLSVSKSTEITSQLFKAVDLGRFRLEDIGETLGNITVIAADLGVEFTEVAAALAQLSIQGIQHANAQTFLRNVLLKMVRPTKAMSQFFDELGVASGEAAIEAFGFAGFLQRLEDRVNSTNEPLNELGELFGRIRAIIGAAGLDFEEFVKTEEEIRNSSEDAAKALDKIRTTGRKLRDELIKVKNELFRFGEGILENIVGLDEKLIDFTTAMRGALEVLKIGAIFAFNAAIAKMLLQFSKLFAAIQITRVGFGGTTVVVNGLTAAFLRLRAGILGAASATGFWAAAGLGAIIFASFKATQALIDAMEEGQQRISALTEAQLDDIEVQAAKTRKIIEKEFEELFKNLNDTVKEASQVMAGNFADIAAEANKFLGDEDEIVKELEIQIRAAINRRDFEEARRLALASIINIEKDISRAVAEGNKGQALELRDTFEEVRNLAEDLLKDIKNPGESINDAIRQLRGARSTSGLVNFKQLFADIERSAKNIDQTLDNLIRKQGRLPEERLGALGLVNAIREQSSAATEAVKNLRQEIQLLATEQLDAGVEISKGFDAIQKSLDNISKIIPKIQLPTGGELPLPAFGGIPGAFAQVPENEEFERANELLKELFATTEDGIKTKDGITAFNNSLEELRAELLRVGLTSDQIDVAFAEIKTAIGDITLASNAAAEAFSAQEVLSNTLIDLLSRTNELGVLRDKIVKDELKTVKELEDAYNGINKVIDGSIDRAQAAIKAIRDHSRLTEELNLDLSRLKLPNVEPAALANIPGDFEIFLSNLSNQIEAQKQAQEAVNTSIRETNEVLDNQLKSLSRATGVHANLNTFQENIKKLAESGSVEGVAFFEQLGTAIFRLREQLKDPIVNTEEIQRQLDLVLRLAKISAEEGFQIDVTSVEAAADQISNLARLLETERESQNEIQETLIAFDTTLLNIQTTQKAIETLKQSLKGASDQEASAIRTTINNLVKQIANDINQVALLDEELKKVKRELELRENVVPIPVAPIPTPTPVPVDTTQAERSINDVRDAALAALEEVNTAIANINSQTIGNIETNIDEALKRLAASAAEGLQIDTSSVEAAANQISELANLLETERESQAEIQETFKAFDSTLANIKTTTQQIETLKKTLEGASDQEASVIQDTINKLVNSIANDVSRIQLLKERLDIVKRSLDTATPVATPSPVPIDTGQAEKEINTIRDSALDALETVDRAVLDINTQTIESNIDRILQKLGGVSAVEGVQIDTSSVEATVNKIAELASLLENERESQAEIQETLKAFDATLLKVQTTNQQIELLQQSLKEAGDQEASAIRDTLSTLINNITNDIDQVRLLKEKLDLIKKDLESTTPASIPPPVPIDTEQASQQINSIRETALAALDAVSRAVFNINTQTIETNIDTILQKLATSANTTQSINQIANNIQTFITNLNNLTQQGLNNTNTLIAIEIQGQQSLQAVAQQTVQIFQQQIQLLAQMVAQANALRGQLAAPVTVSSSGGPVNRFPSGGVGNDTVLSLLNPNEFVVNAKQAKNFLPLLTAINSGSRLPSGGPVSSNNFGDINVTVEGGSTPDTTARRLGEAIRREIRRGTLRLN